MHLIKHALDQICPMPAAALCEMHRIDPARLFDTAYMKSRIPVMEQAVMATRLIFDYGAHRPVSTDLHL